MKEKEITYIMDKLNGMITQKLVRARQIKQSKNKITEKQKNMLEEMGRGRKELEQLKRMFVTEPKEVKRYDGNGQQIAEDVYIIKTSKNKFRHIVTSEDDGTTCPICGLEKKTSTHHIIHKRLDCENKALKELRLRMCEDCHDLIHPEGKLVVTINLISEILNDFRNNGTDVIDKYHKFLKFIREEKE